MTHDNAGTAKDWKDQIMAIQAQSSLEAQLATPPHAVAAIAASTTAMKNKKLY